jgi:hypothetical protein
MASICGRGRRAFGASALGTLLILSAGCGSRGTVSGKVTMKDELLRHGMVTFATPDGTWSQTSGIGEDGRYTIERVPPGPVKISVFGGAVDRKRSKSKFKERMPTAEDVGDEDTPQKVRRKAKMGTTGAPPPAGPAVPKKYNDPETSELTYEVKSGPQEHNIELK